MTKMRSHCLGGGITALVAISLLTLTSCQTMPVDTTGMTPEEKRLHEQSQMMQRTIWEGVAAGAIVGALVGALLDSNDPLKGALIGGGLGAVAGGAAGNYVAQKKRQYANQEARLNAMITDVQTENRNLAVYSHTAKSVIESDMQEIEHIEARLEAGEITAERARQELAGIDRNIATIRETLEVLEEKRVVYATALRDAASSGADPNQVAAMRKQVDTLERLVTSLEWELESLVNRRTISSVG